MTPNTQKERLSLAYIGAVVAHAGFHVAEPRVDFDSVDGIIMADVGHRPRIEFQAKATTGPVLKDDHVTFDLSIINPSDI